MKLKKIIYNVAAKAFKPGDILECIKGNNSYNLFKGLKFFFRRITPSNNSDYYTTYIDLHTNPGSSIGVGIVEDNSASGWHATRFSKIGNKYDT